MKSTVFITVVVVLIIFTTSCGQSAQQKSSVESATTDDVREVMDDEQQTAESSRNENSVKAKEAYKAILQSDLTFYSPENKKNYKLNEFSLRTVFDGDVEKDFPVKVERFTFINLIDDDTPTLVLELFDGLDGAFEVLRYQEGTVYGFNFGYRALMNITHDGTSFGSSGASDGSFNRLMIEKDICREVTLGKSQSNPDGSISYYIDDKKVTRAAYDEFTSGMWKSMEKKDVVWNDFTDANIASVPNQDSNQKEWIFPTLLRNSGKIVPFSHVAEYKGAVYTSGFQCVPGWRPVTGVTHPTGGFAVIGDVLIYYCHPGYTSPSPITLYRSDIQGGNVTKITDDLDNFGTVWAAGDRVIYSTINDDDVRTGVFQYDVKTAKSTRLLNEMTYDVAFTLVTFDDEYAYYRLSTSDELWRIRWDGADAQRFEEVQFPDDLYKVEGDDYYFVSIDDDANTLAIQRFSITNENYSASCVLEALPVRALKDGWAYFFKGSTIYKVEVGSGKKVNLSNIPSNMPESQLTEWFIVGENLYIKARSFHKDNAFKVRIYKVPLSGGEMEYQHVEWEEFES